ncbi:hypothetical protein [Cellulomonas alba]|uniref:LTD domain-containing protein n=1 Tax=Cellulomonas alba TaxID=3053467 RepID=A0ABT7SBU7_9CELL|nr:hypothetical protein [Cellulomonas alba]MDM7853662.1 hypothetical protein [Cellulomonas alba]
MTFAVGWVDNTSSHEVIADPAATLVNPTPGITLAGYYLSDPSAASTTVNGGDFTMPANPPLTVPPKSQALIVIGIGLASGVHVARADGIEFHYREKEGRSGLFRTRTVLQTSDGDSCPDWTPTPTPER